jgi:putative ATPase
MLAVENGSVILIGATTENPSFQVNNALLSRARVIVLTKLDPQHLVTLLKATLRDKDRGLGSMEVCRRNNVSLF